VTADFEAVLRERFARQDDLHGAGAADLADVRSRVGRHRERQRAGPPVIKKFLSRRILLALAASALAAGGAGAGVAITAGSPPPVTEGFSALDDPSLPPAPETTDPSLSLPYHSVMDMFRGLGPGPYEARKVGDGMYLARRGSVLCAVVVHGSAQCTDRLSGDVWFGGDQLRSYDAQTAPFEIHLYGFARDSVASIRVTTANGVVMTVPVVHNAFQTTLTNTTFDEITGLEVIYASGKTNALDPRDYYRSSPARP
jgi:hypothetical protein